MAWMGGLIFFIVIALLVACGVVLYAYLKGREDGSNSYFYDYDNTYSGWLAEVYDRGYEAQTARQNRVETNRRNNEARRRERSGE